MPATDRSRRWIDASAAGVLLLVFVLILKRVALRDEGDDQFFLRALDDHRLVEFLIWRYQTWSGRTLPEGLLAATIGLPLVWKLGIPAAFVGAGYCIWRLTLQAVVRPLPGTTLMVLLMLLISRAVRVDAAYWVTGFYNYLLPFSLGLLALVMVRDLPPRSWWLYLVALPCVVICAQTEQGALVILPVLAGMAAMRLSMARSCRAEIVLLLAAAVAASALLLAPGVQVRHIAELRWFPEFTQMGLFEKLALGLDRINAHVHNPRNFLWLVVAGLAVWTTWPASRTFPARAACAILALFLLHALVAAVVRNVGGDLTLPGLRTVLSPEEWMRGRIFVSYAFTICVLGALMTAAVCRAKNWPACVVGAGLPLLAVLSTMAVALSPTIYASIFRVLFVGDLLLVAHCGHMLAGHLRVRKAGRAEAIRAP